MQNWALLFTEVCTAREGARKAAMGTRRRKASGTGLEGPVSFRGNEEALGQVALARQSLKRNAVREKRGRRKREFLPTAFIITDI